MSNNIRRQGVGLPSLFATRTTGWPQNANTGIQAAGTDISATYAPASTGTAYGSTGILRNGVDIGTLFAALGTTNVQVAQQPSAVSGSLAAGTPSGTVTSNTTTVLGTKGRGSYSYTWVLASGSASFTAPNSATTAVTANVNASSTINGTMYCNISDGTTSVNTNTVSWSLQNTSSAGTVSITNRTLVAQVGATFSGECYTEYVLLNTGVAQGNTMLVSSGPGAGTSGGGLYTPEWLSGGTPSNYSVFATQLNGAPMTGSGFGSWLSLANSRSWRLSAAGGDVSAQVQIQIALTSNLIPIASATISFNSLAAGSL